uniref:Copine domain-containing protein n=1 Tax=Macrostomum lignano TaxID=282301 RepID=A0A1I8IXS0_9PLAT
MASKSPLSRWRRRDSARLPSSRCRCASHRTAATKLATGASSLLSHAGFPHTNFFPAPPTGRRGGCTGGPGGGQPAASQRVPAGRLAARMKRRRTLEFAKSQEKLRLLNMRLAEIRTLNLQPMASLPPLETLPDLVADTSCGLSLCSLNSLAVKEPPRDAEAAADSAKSPRQLRKFSSLTSSSSAASAEPLPPTNAAPGGISHAGSLDSGFLEIAALPDLLRRSSNLNFQTVQCGMEQGDSAYEFLHDWWHHSDLQAQFITLLVVVAAVYLFRMLFGRQEVYIHCGGVTEAECCHSANPDRPLPGSLAKFPSNPDRFRTLNEVKDALRKAGLESANLIFGIDFTASNNFQGAESFGGRSLHDLHSGGLNPYQSVIITLGETMETFQTDCDGHIPAFGFGDFRYKNGAVFPLGTEDTCCGFQVAGGHWGHLLRIPGVGDGPWDMMVEFDKQLPQRQFDNFRFVNYHATVSENRHNPEIAFAVAALMEIPDQRCLLLFILCLLPLLQLLLAAQILLPVVQPAGEEHNGRVGQAHHAQDDKQVGKSQVQEDRPGCEGSEGRGDAEGGVRDAGHGAVHRRVPPVHQVAEQRQQRDVQHGDAGEHQADGQGAPGLAWHERQQRARQAAQHQAAGRHPAAPSGRPVAQPHAGHGGREVKRQRRQPDEALLRVRGLVAVVHPDAQRGGEAVVGQVGHDQAARARRDVRVRQQPPQRRRLRPLRCDFLIVVVVWHYEMIGVDGSGRRRREETATASPASCCCGCCCCDGGGCCEAPRPRLTLGAAAPLPHQALPEQRHQQAGGGGEHGQVGQEHDPPARPLVDEAPVGRAQRVGGEQHEVGDADGPVAHPQRGEAGRHLGEAAGADGGGPGAVDGPGQQEDPVGVAQAVQQDGGAVGGDAHQEDGGGEQQVDELADQRVHGDLHQALQPHQEGRLDFHVRLGAGLGAGVEGAQEAVGRVDVVDGGAAQLVVDDGDDDGGEHLVAEEDGADQDNGQDPMPAARLAARHLLRSGGCQGLPSR